METRSLLFMKGAKPPQGLPCPRELHIGTNYVLYAQPLLYLLYRIPCHSSYPTVFLMNLTIGMIMLFCLIACRSLCIEFLGSQFGQIWNRGQYGVQMVCKKTGRS